MKKRWGAFLIGLWCLWVGQVALAQDRLCAFPFSFNSSLDRCTSIMKLDVHLEIPQWLIDYPNAYQAVADELRALEWGFYQTVYTDSTLSADTPAYLHASYQALYHSDQVVSLWYQVKRFTVGAQPHQWVEVFVLDLGADRRIALGGLLRLNP